MPGPKTWRMLCLAALVLQRCASVEEQCDGGAGECEAQAGSFMQLGRRPSGVPLNTLQRTVHGVPVSMQGSKGTFSTTDDTTWEWIMVIKEGAQTKATVHRMCEEAPHCTAMELELGMVILNGTGAELEGLIARSPDEVESVGTDALIYAIPDLAEEAGSMSAMSQGAPSADPQVKSWGLDRIDARQGLDDSYETPEGGGGEGVHVYVLDTGIFVGHADFGGRAVPTLEVMPYGLWECGRDVTCAADRQGHGTHCAATVGGSAFGVAKGATIHAVKVLGDDGGGSFSGLIRALDWILRKGDWPAVVSASLGGPSTFDYSKAAFDRTTARGVTVVVAAGNENDDACSYTPAYIPSVITVGATGRGDRRAWFSNYGSCTDLFAPGVSIRSAGHRSADATATMQGTSMACPHVAGAAALLLKNEPSLAPAAVARRLTSSATMYVVTDAKRGSPDRLLYVGTGPQLTTTTTTTTRPPVLQLSFGWLKNVRHDDMWEVGNAEYFVKVDDIVEHPHKGGSASMHDCNWLGRCRKATQDFRGTTLTLPESYTTGGTRIVVQVYEDDQLRDEYTGHAEVWLVDDRSLGYMEQYSVNTGGSLEVRVDRVWP